jgi:hypothetical protein
MNALYWRWYAHYRIARLHHPFPRFYALWRAL